MLGIDGCRGSVEGSVDVEGTVDVEEVPSEISGFGHTLTLTASGQCSAFLIAQVPLSF